MPIFLSWLVPFTYWINSRACRHQCHPKLIFLSCLSAYYYLPPYFEFHESSWGKCLCNQNNRNIKLFLGGNIIFFKVIFPYHNFSLKVWTSTLFCLDSRGLSVEMFYGLSFDRINSHNLDLCKLHKLVFSCYRSIVTKKRWFRSYTKPLLLSTVD